MRWLALALCLVACREAGTITVKLDVPGGCAQTATHISLDLIRNGSCAACTCDQCECTNQDDQTCTQGCEDGVCPLSELDAGIHIDPPEPGRYAAVIKLYEKTGVVANRLAIFCAELDAEADGTASKMIVPDEICGCTVP